MTDKILSDLFRIRDSFTVDSHLDLTDDIAASAVVKLMAALDTAGILGSLVGKDAAGGAFEEGWVFAGFDQEDRPFRNVEGTGKACIVLHSRNEWNSSYSGTARYPVLMALVYADSSRSSDGTIMFRDAEVRARKVTKVIVDCFHDVANVDHEWPGGVIVCHCSRSAEGTNMDDVPDADGVVRASTRFEVMIP